MIYLVKTVLIPVPRYVECVGECQASVGPDFGGFGGTGPGARKFPVGVAGFMLALSEQVAC